MPSHKGGVNTSCSSPTSNASMDPCSPEGSTHSSRSGRQRLRPWLEAQVNSGDHPGLQWLDRENRIFRMTWKHGGRADWSEEDGSIFKAWAVHTGRFREGVDEPDWPTWKTRLRCAINKLKPDIQELKHRSCSEEPNPFRVFQFTDRKDSGSSSPPQGGSPASVSDDLDDYRYVVQDRPSVIQPNNGNIPTIISESFNSKASIERHEDCVDSEVSILGSDLQNVSIKDLVPPQSIPLGSNISMASNFSSMDTGSLTEAGGQRIKSEPLENADSSYLQTQVNDSEMLVILRLRNEIIYQFKVVNPHGCRVFYGDCPCPEVWCEQVFGSQEADQIMVPYSPGQLRSADQESYTQTVLQGMDLGVSIRMNKSSIYLQRRCKTRIIASPANTGEKSTRKVGRNETLKVFDFHEHFLPAFMQYQQGEGPRPSPQVVIAVGQDFHMDTEPYANILVSITVCHAHASYLLSQHTAANSAPEMSHSNHFDEHMKLLKDYKCTLYTNPEQMAALAPTCEEPLQQ
ncbi:interferon regulatory factor 8-like [Babylonia areolata]|uniref:interferon regulatory factor 8-like n=1 Tax=Babylonia areolata TaxID=304850 RepID=UPI003FD5E01B